MELVSRFSLGEGKAALRVLARHEAPLEEQTYTITMIQVGGWGAAVAASDHHGQVCG